MIVSGFSGNEIFCLAQKGWSPGSIVVGNSVQSLGVVGGLSSGLRTIAGGEIDNLTKLIVEGRHAAIDRLEKEAGPEVEKQIDRAFQLALCRSPTESEKRELLAFLRTQAKDGAISRTAREQMCRVIFNLNEFVYPD